MKRYLAVFLAGFAAGCAAPNAPTPVPPPQVAVPEGLHHNIPATTDDGHIVYLCTTQPRSYSDPDGRPITQRDHYIRSERCPTTPIE